MLFFYEKTLLYHLGASYLLFLGFLVVLFDHKNITTSYVLSDVALSELDKEKTLSFINAWEHNQKAKVENK